MTIPAEPTELIPHREPFLFLDEIIELTPGQAARGRWRLDGSEPFFAGHFPGRPTLPGVLMIEAIAQLGVAVVRSDDRFAGKLPLFGGVDKARFRRQVVPGDVLDLQIELERLTGRGRPRAGSGQCRRRGGGAGQPAIHGGGRLSRAERMAGGAAAPAAEGEHGIA